MKKLNSFSSKLMFLFSLSIIIPIILMSIILCKYFYKSLAKQNITQLTNTLNSVSSNITTYLLDLERLTLTPYMYMDTFNFMEKTNSGHYNNSVNDIVSYNETKNYTSTLKKLINQSRQDILAITFIPYSDMSKSYTVTKYYDSIVESEIDNASKSFIDSVFTTNGDIFITPVHTMKYSHSTTDSRVFSLMRVIKNLSNNKIIGIIKIDAKENYIKNIISSIKISDNSLFMLVDQDKQIIYSKGSFPSKIDKDSIFSNLNESTILNSYNIISIPISNKNWSLLYLDSKLDLFKQVNIIFVVVFILFIVLFLLTSIVFRLNSNDIIKSIDNITSTMKTISKGNLNVSCHVTGNNELEYISDELNKMITTLDNHIKSEQAALISVKNAEYLALQSQINPHFLCNTLNGFIALNRLGEKQLLEESLLQLSSLYRYTCSNSNVATLKDELLFLEKYLTLQKLRFEDRIEFKINFNDETSNIKFPKLTLQPLIENSIKHGFKDFDIPILITINSYFDIGINNNKILKVSVIDNGIGFNKLDVDLEKSTGLNNVKMRIEYFKEGSNLNIESSINNGTKCIIEIPIMEGENENIDS